jgi:hypothetical protein
MLKPFLFVFKELEEGRRIPHGGLRTGKTLRRW